MPNAPHMNDDAFDAADIWPVGDNASGTERFSEKTLRGIADLARDVIFSQRYTSCSGLMQRLDPRVKLITTAGLVVLVSLCRNPAHVACLYAVTLIIADLSKIPMGYFVKRVWLFIPLFSAAIAIPALFLVPGDTILHVARIGSTDVVMTRQGTESAIMFVLRVAASVSFVLLTTLTTKWPRLLNAMRAVGIPSFFVMIVGMTYRYIFMLLSNVEEQYLARRSRPPFVHNAQQEREWVAARMGTTFARSMHIGEEVYAAMIARGFTGDVRIVDVTHPGIIDIVWCAFIFAVFAAIFLLGGFH